MPQGIYPGNQNRKVCRRGHNAWRYFRDGSRRVCKECQAMWRRRNPEISRRLALEAQAKRKAIVNELKARPCMDCGIQYPPYVMEFDHLDYSTKIDAVSRLLMHSLPKVLAEIEKCEIVCSNCHRVRTHSRNQRPDLQKIS